MDFPAIQKFSPKNNIIKKISYIIIYIFVFLILAIWIKTYQSYNSNIDQKLLLWSWSSQNLDNNVSQIISNLQKIYQWYTGTSANANILTNYDREISQIISDLPKISKRIPDQYKYIYAKTIQLGNYKSDIYNIFWLSGSKTYLIALMNTNEIRPNGGFWWSYMIVKMDGGRLISNKIYDSYYPNYIYSGLYIQGPDWLKQIYDTSKIWFVSSNKIWFTDWDGYHISKLYEKAFLWEKIDGVIFVKSSLIKDILWWWDKKFRERQFVNANIDQISGADTKNKKQIYIDQLQQYIDKNKQYIILQFAKNSQKLISENNIQLYLPYVSIAFRDRLINNGLTTSYNPDYIYSYDTNMSYSKVDGFVNKQIYINEKTNDNAYKISVESSGYIDMIINYSLNIPNIYIDYINSLTKKYNINMSDREKHILALDNIRNNRWTLRLPKWSKILQITGDIYDYKIFQTPFADGLMYFIKNQTNHTNKILKLKIYINQN